MTPKWFLLRTFEVWLTTRLLASPTFHRMVGRVHGRVQRFRHGTPPEEMGGTKLDNNGMAALSTRSRIQTILGVFQGRAQGSGKGKTTRQVLTLALSHSITISHPPRIHASSLRIHSLDRKSPCQLPPNSRPRSA
ncbi:hypothetical protein BJX68DRAFT_84927 [Aspergillus pseudodeflectus]|uniref:Secreted protein n=1 Tax=Aspergillus pseudodeflectus TaxID=176178 RepID=A0ABR4L788_9EURO